MIRNFCEITVAIAIFFAFSNVFAQGHTLQVDNGIGANSIIKGSATGGTYTLQDGGGIILTTGGGGGLVNFTESLTTTAPYSAADAAARLLATNATATDIAVVLQPKGAGGLQAQLADNAVAGGNKRGQYAVDWQINRGANTQVASGFIATIGGGNSNTASGNFATVGGGNFNTANSGGAVVGGGSSNTAGNQAATVGGGQVNIASGFSSTVGGGTSNTASGNYSFIPGGIEALASNYGQMAQASGAFATAGDAQTSIFVLRQQTTNNVATSLALNAFTTKILIPANGAMTFKATIVGKIIGNTAVNVGGWEIIGTITNNAGVATIMGANILRTLNTPAGWAVPTATGNGANMDIKVTGAAATTIDWVARVETVEVVF